MADWRDKFREGSFRGVPFKTDKSTVTGGRRKQDREFAKRDEGNSEDLGKKLKSFNLELLVIGDDYFAQRDALEEALDVKGPGELIHPYRGTIQVQAGLFTLVETVDEGRMARFNVQFTPVGKRKFPEQVDDELNKAKEAADAAKENSKGFFESVFDIANQAAFVVESAADKIDAVVDFAEDAVRQVTEPIENFTFAVRNIKASVNDLIKLPGELAQRLQDTFDSLLSEFENDPDIARRILGIIAGGITADPAFLPVATNTPSRTREQENQDAVLNLTIELTLSAEAQAAVDVEFTSTREALDSRDEIVQGLDVQLDNAVDDDLFQSLKDLQTALSRAIPTTGVTELIVIEVKKTIPALIIAYDNFEDLDKENEIIDQNNIEHPGFVPGGDTIEVSVG